VSGGTRVLAGRAEFFHPQAPFGRRGCWPARIRGSRGSRGSRGRDVSERSRRETEGISRARHSPRDCPSRFSLLRIDRATRYITDRMIRRRRTRKFTTSCCRSEGEQPGCSPWLTSRRGFPPNPHVAKRILLVAWIRMEFADFNKRARDAFKDHK